MSTAHLSEFLNYLACDALGSERIPSLAELSSTLGVSIARLREQLEVARFMGVVEVRPKTGIRRIPYTFRPAICQSLDYALIINPAYFVKYSDLRNHLESAYFIQAASLLNADDIAHLKNLVIKAKGKLYGKPIQVPHAEHKELHLFIYHRLDNPFVEGLLEAYWDQYEAVGLNVFTDINYLQAVWNYHEKMVDSISNGNYAMGHKALMEHLDLITQRVRPIPKQQFE